MRKPQMLVAIQLILFTILAATVFILPSESGTLQKFIGLALMICGAVTGLIAIMQHPGGPNISPEPKHSGQLIQSGLYRWVRHPIYTGVLLGALGVAVFHGHFVDFIIFAVFLVFFTYKSRYEESLLQQVYAEYVTYMQHTGRFIPPLRSTGQKRGGA